MFLPQEYEQRRDTVCRTLAEREADALLCRRAESVHWLCGAEPVDDGLPQWLLLDADGHATLLAGSEDAPAPDLPVDAWRPWAPRPGAGRPDGAAQLGPLLDERRLRGARVAVEEEDCDGGLGPLEAGRASTLPADVHWRDAAGLVDRLRAIKSPREMAFIRRAAGLADDALDAALARVRAGTWEGEIAAAMQAAVLQGGGSHSAWGWRIASGTRDAGPTRRHLGDADRLTLQWAGAYRHYHAAMSRTLACGPFSATERDLHGAALDALTAALGVCVPGAPCDAVFAAYARALEHHGLRPARHCGYAVGVQFGGAPVGVPVLERGNANEIAAGMALFLRADAASADRASRVTLGFTVEITDAGAVSLHRHRPQAHP